MRQLLYIAVLGLTAALFVHCGSSETPPAPDLSMPAAPDLAAPPTLTACLERADDLPRPPQATLPCELIPPGP